MNFQIWHCNKNICSHIMFQESLLKLFFYFNQKLNPKEVWKIYVGCHIMKCLFWFRNTKIFFKNLIHKQRYEHKSASYPSAPIFINMYETLGERVCIALDRTYLIMAWYRLHILPTPAMLPLLDRLLCITEREK